MNELIQFPRKTLGEAGPVGQIERPNLSGGFWRAVIWRDSDFCESWAFDAESEELANKHMRTALAMLAGWQNE